MRLSWAREWRRPYCCLATTTVKEGDHNSWTLSEIIINKTLSERERRRPSRIACEISFENDFTSSSSKSDSLVHVRDCTPSWVKELPGGVADDVIFPIRVVGLRVGPSEMGLLR